MKTNLKRQIRNKFDAMGFLEQLHLNGESFHPEDDAHDIIFETEVSSAERDKLNILMNEVYEVEDFDACEFILNFLTIR